ncbi:MAG: response regulator [Candidatus Aminicenantes bacterium]|nr:response regulator [Candidatus Aminicenantes bacterium]
MKKILIAEDDMAFRETLAAALEAENYQVVSVEDGEKALLVLASDSFDLLVLDLVMPVLGGFDICQKLRGMGNMAPIIFMSGQKKDEIDKVLGLELGGDDYLIKPFGTRELIARIKAVLRRSQVVESLEWEQYAFGDIRLDFKKQTAYRGEDELYLTVKEFGLLKLLIQNEGGVVRRETILNEVWGYEKFPTTRTVDTFIHNLRKKIEEDPSRPKYLITVPWAGYKFVNKQTT